MNIGRNYPWRRLATTWRIEAGKGLEIIHECKTAIAGWQKLSGERKVRIKELEAELASRRQHAAGGGVIEDVDGSVRSMFDGLSKDRMNELETLVEKLQSENTELKGRKCATCGHGSDRGVAYVACSKLRGCILGMPLTDVLPALQFGCTAWEEKTEATNDRE